MKTEWDYSDRAATYDRRADYSPESISFMLETADISTGDVVAEIGAGTGKLTKMLLQAGLKVNAVEPNDEMRAIGIKNTEGQSVTWAEAAAEDTKLSSDSYKLAAFGSSFNVTDRQASLKETARLLAPGGWFACMWNHRDLNDPVQKQIEGIIKTQVSAYSYGSRREDQTDEIAQSGLFKDALMIERSFTWETPVVDYIDAWKSHATLARQAGPLMDKIIRDMTDLLSDQDSLEVPYTTRMWMAQLK